MKKLCVWGTAAVLLLAAALSLRGQNQLNRGGGGGGGTRGAQDTGVRGDPAGAGSPIAGLTAGQLAAFHEGAEAFQEIAAVHDPAPGEDLGLGPGFNSDSCVSCHSFPAVGGTTPRVNPLIAVATSRGARNSIPWFIRPDGPALEARFKNNRDGSKDGGVHNLFSIAGRTDAEGCRLAQEDFSNRANISFRQATPAFGLGLVEAIPDSALKANLEANSRLKSAAGIRGLLNTNGNDGTVTRFGWKAQNKSLAIFAAEAYNVEMGVTNLLFPQERHEVEGCNYNGSSEDAIDFDTNEFDDIPLFAAFMRFLAPPARGPIDDSVRRGERLFESTGCALCHTQSFKTGKHVVAALSEKTLEPYSDFALHSMGPGLADDIEQGRAAGDQFRTAPLWGVGQRIFFLHDGRTSDLMEAIQGHASQRGRTYQASEANTVIERFNRLPERMQQDILNFLRSL